jgi:hypothetical protein
MSHSFRLPSLFGGCIFLLLLPALMTAQSVTSSKDSIILEVINTACDNKDCYNETTRVFADGRYLFESEAREQTKSGNNRKVLLKEEKQLEPAEVAELIDWAEQADFLDAQPKYVVTTKVIDSNAHATITYSNKGRDKRIIVYNFAGGTAAEKSKVPVSVLKLLRWAQPGNFPL